MDKPPHAWAPYALSPFSLALLTACGAQPQSNHELNGGDDTLKVTTSEGPKTSGSRNGPIVVNIDTTQAAFAAQTNIKNYIGRSASGNVEATKLLSSYAEAQAYKKPSSSGPNCWHSSIASIFSSWGNTKRFVGDKEFACHMKTSFKETKKPTFGDVIRFRDDKGAEVHGATYIGVDGDGKAIAFSKNGYDREQGYYFMTLDTVKRVYSEGSSITYWTPMKEAKDPQQGMDCYEESQASRMEDKSMKGVNNPDFPFDM